MTPTTPITPQLDPTAILMDRIAALAMEDQRFAAADAAIKEGIQGLKDQNAADEAAAKAKKETKLKEIAKLQRDLATSKAAKEAQIRGLKGEIKQKTETCAAKNLELDSLKTENRLVEGKLDLMSQSGHNSQAEIQKTLESVYHEYPKSCEKAIKIQKDQKAAEIERQRLWDLDAPNRRNREAAALREAYLKQRRRDREPSFGGKGCDGNSR